MICHMTASAYSSPQQPYKYLTPISYKSFNYLMQKRPHPWKIVACHHFIYLQKLEIIFVFAFPSWKSALFEKQLRRYSD